MKSGKSTSYGITRIILATAAAALFIGGCSGPQVVKKEPVFFPSPPNPPRVQFLKSISGSRDVEDEPSKFVLFMSGATDQDVNRPIVRPYGVRYSKGKLYVCDTQGRYTVIVMDLQKKTFEYLKGSIGAGKLKKPVNLEVAPDGTLFVADTIRREVMIYNADGEFMGSLGKDLDIKPVDVAVDKENIYVLDLQHGEIKVFDLKTRRYLRSIGKSEDINETLTMATNFFLDEKGQFYVTNIAGANVKIYDKDGHFLGKFGQLGDAFGEFARPKGIAVDKQNRTWVVDGGFQNVQVFNENKRLLLNFADPPLPYGALNLPAGIAITTENLDYFQQFADKDFVVEQVIFVTNQMGNSMISIYGLGHKKEASPAAAAGPAQGTDGKGQIPQNGK